MRAILKIKRDNIKKLKNRLHKEIYWAETAKEMDGRDELTMSEQVIIEERTEEIKYFERQYNHLRDELQRLSIKSKKRCAQ